MTKAIKNRKTIFIVVEKRNDGGWWLSNNVKALDDKEAAEYYAQKLNDENADEELTFSVEELTLLET
jgi:hypothetical protein